MGTYTNIGKETAKLVEHTGDIRTIAAAYQRYADENPDIIYLITRAEDHEETQEQYGTGWCLWAADNQTDNEPDDNDQEPFFDITK